MKKETIVVPVVQEEVCIEKHQRETRELVIRNEKRQHDVVLNESLRHELYDTREVVCDLVVSERSGPRVEGDTVIIPLYEERIVTQKQLVLKSELHITKREEFEKVEIPLTLEHDEVCIESTPIGGNDEITSNRNIQRQGSSGESYRRTGSCRTREGRD